MARNLRVPLAGGCFLWALAASAYSSGITGYSRTGCNGCHGGGGTPSFKLSGPSSINAGSSAVFSLSISGGSGGCGGLDVSASGASLSLSGSNGPHERVSGGEVTHSSPGSYSGSSLVYTFTVKAGTGTSLTLYAAGLAGCSFGVSHSALTSLKVTINVPPTVAQAASASPSTITGDTTKVSVLGAYSGGESKLTYHWSSSPSGATFSPNGTNAAKSATATFAGTGTYVLTAKIVDPSNQSVSSSTSVVVKSSTGQSPVITRAAAPAQSPVTGTTVGFSVGATDPTGGTLSYAWTGSGPGSVSFSPDDSSGAASPQATFTAAGNYTVTVVVTGGGGTTASHASVDVSAVPTAVAISPEGPSVAPGERVNFAAKISDQFGAQLAPGSNLVWSATGDGTIDASGMFTAGASAGSAEVQAKLASLSASTTVTISSSSGSSPGDGGTGPGHGVEGGCANASGGAPVVCLALLVLALVRRPRPQMNKDPARASK